MSGWRSIPLRKGLWSERGKNENARYPIHTGPDLRAERGTSAALIGFDGYRQRRIFGKSHASALRCLGQRWLKILWKMWQTNTRYDPEIHTASKDPLRGGFNRLVG
jgi:hypothetical protein